MELLLKLLLAHFVGDFLFQTSKWVKDKEEKGLKSKFFWLHIATHLVLMFILTAFQVNLMPLVLGIAFSHVLIDFMKIKLQNKLGATTLFFTDQMLHLIIIVAAVALHQNLDLIAILPHQEKILVLILAVVLLTSVAGVVMKVFLSRWELVEFENDSLQKAGLYIGVFERLFIFGFIFLNYWAGIGFLIAAKSIFRFSDLSRAKDRKLTEYVLIGTLLSYGIAILIALISLQIWQKY